MDGGGRRKMVAKTISLPNVRELFIPDPGYIIADCDLAQADAQVVAWDANAPKLKQIFKRQLDLHDENAMAIYKRIDDYTRAMAKRGVHATNYAISPRSLAIALGIKIREAEMFIATWFSQHPQIPIWHDRINQQISLSRTVHNAFGFRKVFFDRIDNLLPQALAWIPQSTVAIVINKGLLNLHRNLPEVQPLLQVHDSLVLQFKRNLYPAILPKIQQQLTIPIPYPDPLTIPVGIAVSTKSWGKCKNVSWQGEFEKNEEQSEAGF